MSKNVKPKRWRAVDFVTPAGSVRRAFAAIAHTAGTLKETAADMKAALPDQARPGDFPEGDLRNISDSKERFWAMFELHQWTEKELEKQVSTLRRTKLTAMCVSIFSLVGVVVLGVNAPVWMAIILIPASGSLLILGFAQAFKYALYQTQVVLRDFISARQFVAREDFWTRMFG